MWIVQQKRERENGSGEASARKRKVSTAPESDDDKEEEESTAAHGCRTLVCVKCREAGRTCTWVYWVSNVHLMRCDPCRDDLG